MNINLSKFKKISDNEKMAVLQHPGGHKITISKHVLSPDMHKELSKLPIHAASGTMIEDPEAPMASMPEEIPQEISPDQLYEQKVQEKLKQIKMDSGTSGDPFAGPGKQSEHSFQMRAEEAAIRDLESSRANELAAAKRLELQHQHDLDLIKAQNARRAALGISAPAQAAPADMAINTQEMPMAAPALPDNVPSTSIVGPDTPITSSGAIKQSDLSKPYDTAMAGVQNQLQATQGLGHVQQEQAKQNEQIYAQNVLEQQQQRDRAHQIFSDLQKEHDAFMGDYKNQHIDPQHYLNSMGVGQKIATGIGLILGGIGSAGLGRENSVSAFLNTQIQNDMEAQKAEMGKKQNLIAANFQHFGNMKQAEEMYQAQTKSILADKIIQQANKSGSQAAMLNAQQAAGKLQWEASQHLQAIAFQQMANDQMKQANAQGSQGAMANTPALINMYRMSGREEMAKALEERFVPGVGVAQNKVPEAVRTQIQTRQNLDNKVNDLIKFAKTNQGTVWDRGKVAQGEAMVNLLTDAYRQANNQGVFKESEKNFVGSFLKEDPTAFFANFRTLPGYQQVHKDNLDTLNSLKASVGLPTTFVPKSAAPYKGR